jgi:hypothetical protein
MKKKITVALVLAVVGFVLGWLTFGPVFDMFIEKTRNVKKTNVIYNNMWTTSMDIGSSKATPLVRTYIARTGIGGNTSDEAIYWIALMDSKGERLQGGRFYEVRFDKDPDIQKIIGFWSICIYNAKEQFVPNPMKRYNLGDRSPIVKNNDGSFTIYVSPEQPGNNVSNWLPSPKNEELITLVIRMYAPLPGVLKQPEKSPMPTVVRMD